MSISILLPYLVRRSSNCSDLPLAGSIVMRVASAESRIFIIGPPVFGDFPRVAVVAMLTSRWSSNDLSGREAVRRVFPEGVVLIFVPHKEESTVASRMELAPGGTRITRRGPRGEIW